MGAVSFARRYVVEQVSNLQQGFTLTDPSCTTAGCPFNGGAKAGPCTGNAGTLSFAEIEDVIAGGGKVTLDKAAAVKQVVWDNNQWVSYDDGDTFKTKIDYANSKCLGGLMVVPTHFRRVLS